MPGIAVDSCGPPQQEKRKRLSVSFRTEIDPELAPNTYSAVFLSSFVREIRREAVTHNTSHFVRWDRGAPWYRTAPIQLVPLRFDI